MHNDVLYNTIVKILTNVVEYSIKIQK